MYVLNTNELCYHLIINVSYSWSISVKNGYIYKEEETGNEQSRESEWEREIMTMIEHTAREKERGRE